MANLMAKLGAAHPGKSPRSRGTNIEVWCHDYGWPESLMPGHNPGIPRSEDPGMVPITGDSRASPALIQDAAPVQNSTISLYGSKNPSKFIAMQDFRGRMYPGQPSKYQHSSGYTPARPRSK